jgi:hypothetical protein
VSLSQKQVQTKLMNFVGPYVPGEPGQPWTEEEALIVKAKLQYLASNAEDYMEAYMEELNAAGTPFECATEPATNFTTPCDGSWPDPLCTKKVCKIFNNEPNVDNFAAKMLRLGFHDCFKYEDGVGGGCDGCLNFGTMFRKYSQTNSFQNRIWPDGVDVGSGNNGLAIVADLLEKVYTDPNYPDSLPVGGFEGERPKTLSASLQSTGKSRSDLWAFAAMVGAEWGAMQNNMACDETPGRDKEKYKHLYNSIGLGDICKMTQNTPPTFRTGRRDCPDADKPADPTTSSFVPHRARPYETAKSENQAGVYFNGTQLAEFFRNDFGMTRQETVALMGAHSFGGYTFKNSMFKYQWMWHQAHMMNSNYYRILQSKPSKFVDSTGKDGKTWLSAGGPGGVNAETGFFYRPLRETVSGGPFFLVPHVQQVPPLREEQRRHVDVLRGPRWLRIPDRRVLRLQRRRERGRCAIRVLDEGLERRDLSYVRHGSLPQLRGEREWGDLGWKWHLPWHRHKRLESRASRRPVVGRKGDSTRRYQRLGNGAPVQQEPRTGRG